MTITYPKSQKANPYPQPTLAPTPKLRAHAAVMEAIGSFKGMARSGGMITFFVMMSMMPSKSYPSLDQYFWPMPLILGAVFLSLTFAASDFTPTSKRAKYLSWLDEDRRGPNVLYWIHLAAVLGSVVLGVGILFGRKTLGLPFDDANALSCLILITGQLISLLMDMLRDVKLLRFAQAQLGEDDSVIG